MDYELLSAVLAETERRNPSRVLDPLRRGLFKHQHGFIDDPSKRKAALCSRRAGKSTTGMAYGVQEILDYAEGDVAYIGLTRGAAKKIMFRPLDRLNRKYDLGLELNKSELTATASNGNTFYMTGANTEEDTEKLRGLKCKLILLDECASFRAHLNYLIEEVLDPTLIDTNGTLALLGTPSANPGANYFYKATQDPSEGFSVHKWTVRDNPYVPNALNWLEAYRKRKGWDLDHPIYRREWLGEWTTDGDSLVYKYRASRNDYRELPKQKWLHVMGVDLGHRDAFTICVLAFSYEHRTVYVVDQFKKSGLIPSQMAEEIRKRAERYQPLKIKADCGGLGKAIVEEFKERFHLDIEPAEKTQKAAAIEMANGDLISGRVKIEERSHLASEMLMLQWDPERPSKEDERTPNDLCLAAGTHVATSGGPKPIESIRAGEQVWTRAGLKRVLVTGQTGMHPVQELRFSDGRTLSCTPNHPIYSVERGFIPADALLYGERVVIYPACQPLSVSPIKAGSIADIQDPNAEAIGAISSAPTITKDGRLPICSIGGFGKTILGLFQRVTTFTTRMAIQGITSSTIWSVLRPPLTSASATAPTERSVPGQKPTGNSWPGSAALLPPGIDLPKAAVGIRSMPASGWPKTAAKWRRHAQSVKSLTSATLWFPRQYFIARPSAEQKPGEPQAWTTSRSDAKSVERCSKRTALTSDDTALALVARGPLTERVPVYNLKVEGQPEFYANGLLTHNCDAFLYGFREAKHYLGEERPDLPTAGTPEHAEMQAKEMIERELERFEESQSQSWWEQ